MNTNRIGFSATEILLPDFTKVDGSRWAVVACDQYTSEPAYWEATANTVGDAPSTLRLILPEVYLSETEARVPAVNRAMKEALDSVLVSYPDVMIYLERVQSDGKIRRGVIGAVDLECYEYTKGAETLIRVASSTAPELMDRPYDGNFFATFKYEWMDENGLCFSV